MKKKIGILVSCFVMMCYLGLSPILASVSNEFPDVSQSVIQMLITLPSLVSLVTSLVAGKLAGFVYKKTVLLCAIGFYIVGGLVPIVLNSSIIFLLICSSIMGIGCGLMVTTTAGMICDYFEGNERNMMMGFQGAAIAIGATAFTFLGGWLSNYGWRSVYYAYFLLIPCFIIAFIFLPKGKLEKVENNKQKVKIPGFVWFMCVVGFFFYMFQNVFNTNISMYISELNIGDDQTSSIATMVNTFAGLLGGLFLSLVMKKFKKYTVLIAFILASFGLILTSLTGSLPVILIGGFFVGFAFSTYTPSGTVIVSERVSVEQRSMSIAFLSASNNIGAAVSPIVVNATSGLFSPTVRMRYLISGILMVLVIAATAIRFVKDKHD